ncbi:helix-turn-helix transcriptional regulator [Clostridium sp.]|uniref:helix-turn-helix transcriptional regulator n=1 Tax=Clostridium sp. TaxID=1506 RepID=UPI003D6CC580
MDNYKLKIKEIRLTKKLTQTELTREVGVSRNFLSEIENNKYDIKLSLLCNIAWALDTTPRKLIIYKNKKKGIIKTLIFTISIGRLILDYIRRLPLKFGI